MFDVTTTSPTHWKYISEGGASIVFSYVGPSNQAFNHTALRLRKAPLETLNEPLSEEQQLEDPDDPSIAFQHQVIERLLPEEFLPRLEGVHVNRAWLEGLARIADEHRPPERKARDAVDTRKKKATLATDLVGGKGLAVEIKPKWGFLPSATHLSSETAPVKTTTCRFCMHSHLKATRGAEVSEGYCPLDLFSGDADRIRKALTALWDSWVSTGGSSNNLRVFVEGQMLRPSATPSSIQPLTDQLHLSAEENFTLYTVRDAFISRTLPMLLQTSVLRILAVHQSNLDALDIEGLVHLWARAYASRTPGAALTTGQPEGDDAPPAPPLGAGMPQPTLDEWSAFLDVYLNKHTQMDHDHPDIANLRYYCLAYLLSATFKDCSLIIQAPDQGLGAVTIIDLDVKPIDRLDKWGKLDREIVEAYRQAGRPTQCVAN